MDCIQLDALTPNMCSLPFYPNVNNKIPRAPTLSAPPAALMSINADSDEGSKLPVLLRL